MYPRRFSILSFAREVEKDEEYSFQDPNQLILSLPTPILKPLKRTNSILRRSSIDVRSPNSSVDTPLESPLGSPPEISYLQAEEEIIEEKPLEEKTAPKKTVRFASHVQVQHTTTLYPRNRMVLPYQLTFWKKNIIIHIISLIIFSIIIIIQFSLVGAFWNQNCNKPLKYIVTGNGCVCLIFIIAIIFYSIIQFIKSKFDRNQKKNLRRKTLSKLKLLKETAKMQLSDQSFQTLHSEQSEQSTHSGQTGLGNSEHYETSEAFQSKKYKVGNLFDDLPITQQEMLKDSDISSAIGQNKEEKNNFSFYTTSSMIDEQQIHTSFRAGSTISEPFQENIFEGIPTVTSEDDDDESSGRENNLENRPIEGNPIESPIEKKSSFCIIGGDDPLIISSLRTKVVEASFEEEDRDSNTIDDRTTAEQSQDTNNSIQTSIDNQISPRSGRNISFKFMSLSRSRENLKNRKFRDSIVLNKKNMKHRFDTELIESSNLHLKPNEMEEIPKISFLEDPKQSYSLISESIQQIEKGDMMLEPLNDPENGKSFSIANYILNLFKKNLFGVIFIILWSIPHIWAIISLVFIIDHGECPSDSIVLYITNILYFVFIILLIIAEISIIVLSFK